MAKRYVRNGYVRVKCPHHPKADQTGYVYEHTLVAEAQLGRPLSDSECVHHRNGIRHHNRRENIVVILKKDHPKLHTEDLRAAGKRTRERNAMTPEEQELAKNTGEGLRRLRGSLGLTLKGVGTAVGIHYLKVWNVEHGKVRVGEVAAQLQDYYDGIEASRETLERRRRRLLLTQEKVAADLGIPGATAAHIGALERAEELGLDRAYREYLRGKEAERKQLA